jgi:hypothetical protein
VLFDCRREFWTNYYRERERDWRKMSERILRVRHKMIRKEDISVYEKFLAFKSCHMA